MGAYTGFEKFISGRQTKTVYIESEGMLGEESPEEFLLVLTKVNERLDRIANLRKQFPNIPTPNDSVDTQYELARREVFKDHWKEICEASSPPA
ncbi:hypothetical protein ASF61_06655 [Duganella sp. Leaf126]|nr:hypothetical protein ASF61_06655 [Duganella sp. Leaf126]